MATELTRLQELERKALTCSASAGGGQAFHVVVEIVSAVREFRATLEVLRRQRLEDGRLNMTEENTEDLFQAIDNIEKRIR